MQVDIKDLLKFLNTYKKFPTSRIFCDYNNEIKNKQLCNNCFLKINKYGCSLDKFFLDSEDVYFSNREDVYKFLLRIFPSIIFEEEFK